MKRKPKKFTKFHHVERVKKGRKLVEKLFVETENGVEEYGSIRLTDEKPLVNIDLADEREPGKGVFIKGVLGKYGVFDIKKAPELFQAGYAETMQVFESNPAMQLLITSTKQ